MQTHQSPLHLLLPLLLLAAALAACSGGGSRFCVQGTITGADGKMLYLEHQGLTAIEPIDSVLLTEKGNYRLRGDRPEYPEYYRLRLDRQVIPFSIDSVETLTIHSDAQSFATGYSVEGSVAAEKIKHVWLAQLDANVAMSHLVKKYDGGGMSYEDFALRRDSIMESYKRDAEKMIFEDPKSPVAYFALFQQIDGNLIFNIYDPADSRIFAAVANVYSAFYPSSDRQEHLYNLALRSMAVVRQQRRNAEAAARADSLPAQAVREVGYFDISLPDLEGRDIRLSEVAEGQVTLLSFTVMDTDWSVAYQSQLSQLYSRFASRGLRIYQVGFDSDSYVWKNRVAPLPWTNVRDKDGVYSSLVGLYNIRSLPALFLLSSRGEIVSRVTSFDDLATRLEQLL